VIDTPLQHGYAVSLPIRHRRGALGHEGTVIGTGPSAVAGDLRGSCEHKPKD